MIKHKKEIIIGLIIIATNAVAFTMGMTYGKTQIDIAEETVEMDIKNEEEKIVEMGEETPEAPAEVIDEEMDGENIQEEDPVASDSEIDYELPESESEAQTPVEHEKPTPAPAPAPQTTKSTIKLPDGKGMTVEAYVNEIIKIDAISDKGFEMNATSQYSNTVEKGIIIEVKTDINNYKPGSVIEVVESLGPDRTIAEKPESFEPYEEKLDNVPPLMIQYKYSFSSSLENEILKELNAYRAEHGLNPVTMDATLQKAARWKSNAQLQHNYFGHRDTKYGYTVDVIDYHMDGIDSSIYLSLSENLHYTTSLSTSAKSIVTAWKNSPDHNENMLGDWWNVIGIGVVKSETSGSAFHDTGAVISTQVFGTK